ncbi:MAG: capsid cement protein [Pseudomonadota bacterium]
MSNLILAKAFTAAAAIAPYRIVRLASADTVEQAAAVANALIGVNTDLTIAANERVEVMVQGIAWVEAGAAISIGSLVTTDSVGRGVAAAPAAGVNNRHIGIALDAAAAAGDQIRVLLSPGSVQG